MLYSSPGTSPSPVSLLAPGTTGAKVRADRGDSSSGAVAPSASYQLASELGAAPVSRCHAHAFYGPATQHATRLQRAEEQSGRSLDPAVRIVARAASSSPTGDSLSTSRTC